MSRLPAALTYAAAVFVLLISLVVLGTTSAFATFTLPFELGTQGAYVAALLLATCIARILFSIDSIAGRSCSFQQVADFQYVPLDEGDIRLLEFCQQQNPGDELRFILYNAKLSQRPVYSALSYSWGSTKDMTSARVIVNGQPFRVSRTLASALHRMHSTGHRVLWVDAICINQKDTSEKSKEVTRMFSIYRIAKEVVIWLGHDVGLASDVEGLQKLTEHVSDHTTQSEDSRTITSALTALKNLLMAPYWGRVWIIQEVAAARKTRIYWGEYCFDLPALETIIRDHGPALNNANERPMLAQQVLFVRSATRAQQKPRLMEILELTSASETSVLRDKVYGLLGLASDWRDFVQEPDYSSKVSEDSLCLEMTANFVHWYSSLDIIFLRSKHKHQEGLPTWCPDYFHFKLHAFDHNLITYICGKDANLGWEKRRAFGTAARMNQDVPDSFHVDGRRLALKGVREGYIKVLGGVVANEVITSAGGSTIFPTGSSPSDLIAKAFRRLLLMSHQQTYGHLNGADFFALLYALPEAYYEQTGNSVIWSWLQAHESFFKSFGISLQSRLQTQGPTKMPMRIRSNGTLDETRIPAEWKEYSASGGASSRRRGISFEPLLSSVSFVLDEGVRLMSIGDETLLGWAHRNTQVGDSIWHLEGCTLPAILRKSKAHGPLYDEETYELVGHAYVDPVMASGRWLAREDKSRMIVLV